MHPTLTPKVWCQISGRLSSDGGRLWSNFLRLTQA